MTNYVLEQRDPWHGTWNSLATHKDEAPLLEVIKAFEVLKEKLKAIDQKDSENGELYENTGAFPLEMRVKKLPPFRL